MHAFARLGLVAGTALAASTALAAPALATATGPSHTDWGYPGTSSAVFVQTDNPAGNQVEVYQRSTDGTLSLQQGYATGGLGGVLDGSVVDHQASQGSLTYDSAHHLLYALNAGSNTVSVFAMNGTSLTLRQTIASGGVFPVSVAVHGNVVYVLNAENGGSIQGYRVQHGRLVSKASWNRPLGLDAQATPQFTHTPGQVGFTANGSQLLVTTKAANNSVYVYRLGLDGAPAASPTVNALPGTVPFAFVTTGRHQIALVEVGTSSVVTFEVNSDGTLTQRSALATGQAATCWIARSGDLLFASNAGSATETGARLGFGGALTDLGRTSTDAGAVDAVASPDGRNLYVQTGGAGNVDEYQIDASGSLDRIGSVTVPGAAGGEGIAVS